MELERFIQPLTPQQLEAVVIHNEIPSTQSILELPGLDRLKKKLATGEYSSSDDADVAQQIHGVFRDLDDRTMTDTQMWQWLTTTQFKHYVLDRWKPKNKNLDLTKPSAQAHFLAGGSMAGVSRNALARLYWAANTLWTDDDGYKYSDVVLGVPDLYSGIFEREFGLHPPLAREFAKQYAKGKKISEAEHREWLKNVNHVLTTVVVEGFKEGQLAKFVKSCRP
jgi:hypothetical protein